jgi:hypothetical protein
MRNGSRFFLREFWEFSRGLGRLLIMPASFFVCSAQSFFIAKPIFLRAAAGKCHLWTEPHGQIPGFATVALKT